ncbi:MAG: hypothetical protein FJX80_10735 [Bacteroidetes bacterium]|nr:hypothetical protein [Bacteroidota bacterium]
MSLTKSYAEKLIAVRDEYERRQGPNNDMDQLVRDTLIKLFMHANRRGDIPTVKWCHEQLANERRRTALNPESLVPSGILSENPILNPFNNSLSPLREFVPPAAVVAASAPNPNANRRCNNCNQLGHLRRNCSNPPVPGRRGPGSRGHGSRGGKTRRHHSKNSNRSFRRGKH